MDKKLFAYFDVLGYTAINTSVDEDGKVASMDYLRNYIRSLKSAVEHPLTDKKKEDYGNVFIDVDTVKVKVVVFSDTIIILPVNDTMRDYLEVLKAAYNFNWRSLQVGIPVRGIIYYGDYEHNANTIRNTSGSPVINYSIAYGPAGMEAHEKSDLQQWSGACIDNSAMEILNTKEAKDLIEYISVEYDIPLNLDKKNKYGVFSNRALKLYQSVGETKYIFKNVEEHFKSFGKKLEGKSVVEKFEKTKQFITHLSRLDNGETSKEDRK